MLTLNVFYPLYQKKVESTHIHKPCGYSYLIVSDVDEEQPEIVYYRGKVGENVVEHFLTVCFKNQNTWYNIWKQMFPRTLHKKMK